jgi:hypothetical protein
VFHLWHERHDGMGGHVFLLESQMRELREEMAAQGMVCGREGGRGIPLHKLETPENWYVPAIEIEEALETASPEPATIADPKLWQDFLAFLEGAMERGGLRVK